MTKGITLNTLHEAKEQASFFEKYGAKTRIFPTGTGKYRVIIYASNKNEAKINSIIKAMEEKEIEQAVKEIK